MIPLKLKAGALQFTMYVVVVIALLLGVFVIFVQTHKQFKVQSDFTLETIKNSNKGIFYAMEHPITGNDTLELDILDFEHQSLKIHKDHWGVLEKVTSISKTKNKVFKKIALTGGAQPKMDRTALYLEDKNKPLVLVGNTKIQGAAYLPKQGVRTGNISGHSYYGNALIYGKTKLSKSLPRLSNTLRGQIEKVSSSIQNVDRHQFLDLSYNKVHQNSFYDDVKILYSKSTIDLFDVVLKGNIVVQSETKIVLHPSSKLVDVILIAPQIEIKDNVTSIFQVFATKQITVGENCKLNYPSALVLNNKITAAIDSNYMRESFIELGTNSILKGAIVFLGNNKNYKAQIRIKESSTVVGEIYCNKNVELLGAVSGTVITSGFVANQSGSAYQNHIYNGKISIDDLPEEYVGLSFYGSKKGVAKWLY